MKKTLPLIYALFITTLLFSQTPCNNGFAGAYPCNDYDLLANIPVSVLANTQGNPEGSDIWGWTDPTNGKEYAIIAMTNSTAFVDISSPINPIFLGRLDTAAGTSYWRDVKVYNNHAFIVADLVGNHGMQVFDLTRLRNVTSPPVTFTADAHYTEFGSAHNIVINEDTGYAYIVGTSRSGPYAGGPAFIDISNPTNPTNAGGYANDGYSHDAQVVTYNGPDTEHIGKEIYIGSNESEVLILDVTDKNNVVKLSEITYPQIGYTHQGWFTDDQRYFILGDETDEQGYGFNTRTLVFDFNDLDNPILSSTYYGSTPAIDHNGYVLGDKFFIANYRAGLRVLDITNISAATDAMEEIGYFDTHPESNGTAFNGAWSVYPYFSSGNIIISDIERGLFVVRKSGTLNTSTFKTKETITLLPNPAINQTKISSKEGIIQSIKVYNTLGKVVFKSNNINLKSFVLPTKKLTTGLYLVKINNTTIKKLIIK
ncbi:choice-of-anchor B family protein [Mangrovimonas spongiae]|uniref:Choice-of-anchor B family protein n=1 Tax=Mangrovimonas spongiae TaxID=2494697 RepID=A0A3R9P0R4_9FLAO|nr:choice-of-anchor B family protein [Mangrovimonas spongiae]RSK41748.1 choice-of-anchor B family protein [Mangrovimonas spongiae]